MILIMTVQEMEKCSFLFNSTLFTGMGDLAIGIIILIMSLLILSSCLVLLVKVLQALLKGWTRCTLSLSNTGCLTSFSKGRSPSWSEKPSTRISPTSPG